MKYYVGKIKFLFFFYFKIIFLIPRSCLNLITIYEQKIVFHNVPIVSIIIYSLFLHTFFYWNIFHIKKIYIYFLFLLWLLLTFIIYRSEGSWPEKYLSNSIRFPCPILNHRKITGFSFYFIFRPSVFIKIY